MNRKVMKKILALILAMLLLCSFCFVAACEKGEKPPIDNPGDNTGEDPDDGNSGDEYEILEFEDGQTVVLQPGAMHTLKVKGNNDKLTFESSNAEVAEIDKDLLIVRKIGTATVTAKKDAATIATLTLDIQQPVTGVKLDRTSASILKDGTIQLVATVNPDNATNKNITWASSDESVASVDQTGLVTGLKAGTSNITVTTEEGKYTATCVITVLEMAQSLNGWITMSRDGSVSSVGLLNGAEEGYTSLMHTAAPKNSIVYHEKAFDATQGMKLTFDYAEPCTDGNSWIIVTFGTVAPSWTDGAEQGKAFRFIIRNTAAEIIQVQGDMVDSDGWSEVNPTKPVYSKEQEAHQTLFPVLNNGKKGLTAELTKNEGGKYQVVAANLSAPEYTMTWTLSDEVNNAFNELSDVYVSIEFGISSAPYAPLGRADVKLEGTLAKAITEVKFAEEEVTKFSNDNAFTISPTTQPSDLEPILVWTSSDPSVATVDANGQVTLTGKPSEGVTITAKAMNGAVSDSYKLVVKPNTLEVTPTHAFADDLLYVLSSQPLETFTVEEGSACVSGEKLSMEVGFSGKAYLYFYKKSDLSLVVGYEIKNWEDADGYGVLSLGNKTIEVPKDQLVTEIRLNKTSVLVGLGEAAPVLTATVLPVNATNKTLAWESSAAEVVAVDAQTGAITIKAVGAAVITVKATDGSNVQAQCNITVSEDKTQLGTWTGSNGIMFDKSSTNADDFVIKYTSQNSAAINGIAKNSAAYAFAGEGASLKFSIKWMDNYLQNAKLNWVGFCLTNSEGEGIAIKYTKTQTENAGLNMLWADTTNFTNLSSDQKPFEPGNEGVSDFYFAGVETAYLDLTIERTATGIKISHIVPDNVWYSNYYELTEEQAAKFGDEIYLSIVIQSEGTVTELPYGQISVKKA